MDNFKAGNQKMMAALSEILEPRFVGRFVIEENKSQKNLVEEIKNQFPVVRGCSIRSVKSSVPDETLDLVVQSAISEVQLT